MNSIKRFVSNLLKDMFSDEDKKELIEILTTSLEEKVEDLVEQGIAKEEAIKKSIQEFGSAEDVLDAFPEKSDKKRNMIKQRKTQLLFSIFGYLIVGGISIFINLTFIDFFWNFNWFVVVLIAVLFWPLAMLYRYIVIKK